MEPDSVPASECILRPGTLSMLRSHVATAAFLAGSFLLLPGAFGQDEPLKKPVEAKPEAASEQPSRQVPEGGSPSGATPSPEQRQIRELLQRLERVETELGKIKAAKGQLPAEKKDQKLLILLETPYLGTHYYGGPNGRFFAARLIFINLTADPVTIKKGDYRIEVDGVEQEVKEVPANLQYHSFQIGGTTHQLRNLKPPDEMKIPVGGTNAAWIVTTEVAGGNQVPSLVVRVSPGAHKLEVDVNQYAMGLMGLDVERIGPRQSLGLLTIHGALNTINVGGLVEAVDQLATAKVARAVIRWTDGATPMDGQMLSWLIQSAQMAGRGELQNNQFPSFPASVRELHLSRLPNSDSGNYSVQPNAPNRIHKTDADAVTAALESAYEVLPIDEVAADIEKGHALTRAAAVAGGGGRLGSERLPLLLSLTGDKDPALQRAAIISLRHFGEPEAVKRLEETALKNAEPSATAAVESLAASRFPAAHEALLKILKNEPGASRKRIVNVLAQHPRPIWSETVYEFVKDPNSGLGAEGLKALALVGHPKMIEVFQNSLKDKNAETRNAAFAILAERVDPASEEIAMNYTLEALKDGVPSPPMINLLNRTKDRRAIPLLLAQFDKQPNQRSTLINCLAQIGDQSVGEVFVAKYASLRPFEQTAVLNALSQLRSPSFRKLAGEALRSNDTSLVQTGSTLLQNDASPEAVRMLIDGFEKTNNQNTWSYTSNALAMIGTPEARESLLKARASEDVQRRSYAMNALRNIWQRSPAYQHVYQGQSQAKAEKWNEAVKHFTQAIEVDAEIPDAWAGRANAYLKLNKNKEAKADYQKAWDLDPYNSNAVTGLGILMVLEGDYEGGIKKAEEARAKFPNDPLFAYNVACLYSQATGAVKKDEKAADREQKGDEYTKKALAELKRSIELGFGDFDWMKKDPDFEPIRDLPEFAEIAKPSEKPAPKGVPRPGRRPR